MAMTKSDTLNYLGELYLIGNTQTPFLNMIGGMNGGKSTSAFTFAVAQPYVLSAASQNTQSEDTAAQAGTATTVARGQDKNVCQIMKYDVDVSYKKESTPGAFSATYVQVGNQPVQDELAFQRATQFRQMAIDIEYSFITGSYVAENATSTNQKTRGMVEACTTNTVAAGSTDLTKALIDELLRTMATNGAVFGNMVCFCNGFQKQMISDIYAFAPQDRNIGGVNIKTVETDFCSMGVVYAPQISTSKILIADLSVCYPVFCPYNGQAVSWTDTAQTTAKKGGFWYTQVGLDHGPEEYHGTITGLTTS